MVKSTIYGIVGAGGFGREVMPVARAMLARQGVSKDQIVFVDDGDLPNSLNGHRVLSVKKFFDCAAQDRYFNVAIANSKIRESLVQRFLAKNIMPFSIRAENSINLECNEIGRGAIFSCFSCVSVNVRVGDFFHADMYASLTHDCSVGDFVTFAPKAQCNGGVKIEDHVYVGSGAIIRNATPDRKITIGRGAVIGMGAVVTKSVPAGVTVVGNPAIALGVRDVS